MKKLFAAAALTAASSLASAADIVDTAVSAGQFNTLVKAVQAAGLVDTLKGKVPFTVFAPTDEAFAKVPKATLDALAKDKARLQAVLRYHVLTSRWTSDDVKLVKSTGTAEGRPITIGSSGGTLTINDARIVKADIGCSNGVIHVIDTVLIPK